ncbi:MAG: phosphodiester glycosidase family protein [Muribaculaceae bacterium]|nr:phosphodiester glycosidase family protein [Muribaculaceae bacterium]MBP5315305.1 phosphodiester glycosidase family protein [Muribaculaceae bacterium]
MRKILLATIALSAAFSLAARTQWNLQGNIYNVDTLRHVVIGPGTTHTALKVEGAYNLRVFYTTTDLSDPNVDIRAVKAANSYTGVASTSYMATSSSKEGALYFAGVNADFFGYSRPIGSNVVNSEIIYAINNGWTHFAMTPDKKPHASAMTFTGTISGAKGTCSVTSINGERGENNMVIYNRRRGTSTGTNIYGSEVTVTPVDGTLRFGHPLTVTVTSAPSTAGNSSLSEGKYVLSGHGTAKTFVDGLAVGDQLTINLSLLHNGTALEATQVAGGQPMILSGGQVLDTQSALDHLTSLNPRTAVGYDASGTHLTLLVVDGRSTISQGCVSRVLADIMREVGCTEAMNFDGGGSSTMYVQPLGGVVNKYTDATERSVTNAVFAVATSPTDNEIAQIRFVDWNITLPKYGYYQPVIYGYNQYGVLVNTDVKGFSLSAPAELGEIINDGTTFFANGAGYAALTANYNGLTASVPITIGTAEPQFRKSRILTDTYRDYTVEVFATVLDNDMAIDNSALSWSTENDNIATVSQAGVVEGVADGTTEIHGSVDEFNGTLQVVVEQPQKHYADIDKPIDVTTWKVAKSGVKDESMTAVDDRGFALTYTISSTRSPYIRAAKDIQLYSLPDSLRLVINPGDAVINKITLQSQAYGERAAIADFSPTLTANADNVVLVALSDLMDISDLAKFPLTFKYLMFYVGDANATTHTITVKSIEAVYNHVAPDGVELVGDDSRQPDIVNVYDTQGRLLRRGVAPQNAVDGLTPGIYIVGNRKIVKRQ